MCSATLPDSITTWPASPRPASSMPC
jgi:hypothetical protein